MKKKLTLLRFFLLERPLTILDKPFEGTDIRRQLFHKII